MLLTLIITIISTSVPSFAIGDPKLDKLVGTFRGSYYANQGHTGLTLKVEKTDDGEYIAEFFFYSVPDNPSVPSGRYKCEVTYLPDTGNYYVRGVEWIERPSGYVFVDLEGPLKEGIFEGIVNSHLGNKYTFHLVKQEGENAPSNWAEVTVDDAVLEGYVPLELQNNYKKSITRAEFARLVVAAISLKTDQNIEKVIESKGYSYEENPFDDTSDRYVLAASTLNIVKGYGNRKFGPDDLITREQSAVMLTRLAKIFNVDTSENRSIQFKDRSSFSDWAVSSIDFVTHRTDKKTNTPVMMGSDNLFNPKGNYTKEQAILTIYRLMNSLN